MVNAPTSVRPEQFHRESVSLRNHQDPELVSLITILALIDDLAAFEPFAGIEVIPVTVYECAK